MVAPDRGWHDRGTPIRDRGCPDRRGMALIFVLWILVLLGLAVGELAARARSEARMVATLKSRAVAQYAAESGVLATTIALRTILDSADDPVELAARTRRLDTVGRASTDLAAGGAQFAVSVIDLNARLDLARADSATLSALFTQFIPAERAGAVVAELRQAPVTRFAELARVPGADDALALAVAPYVTVWSDGFVNVNSAPEAVLAALPGIGPARARALVARRGAGELFTSVDAFRPTSASRGAVPVDGSVLTIAPTRLMIVSRGWQRGAPLTHEIQAVYLVLAGTLTLQSWEERDR
jgi:type II secretory pathway component PulK